MDFRIALMRHYPVVVPVGQCYGQTDVPLAEGWEVPAALAAAELGNIGPRWVITSPVSRCLRPAVFLADRLGVELLMDERLKEMNFGAWEGTRWDLIPRAVLDEWAANPVMFAPPGGERGADLLARVRAIWAEIVTRGTSGIVLSHGGPLRILNALARGLAPDLLDQSQPMGSWEIHDIAGSQAQRPV